MMKHLTTEIEIDAPPTKVWSVLMDFDTYPTWNTFITAISGQAHVIGEVLSVKLEPPNASAMQMHPRVMTHVPNEEFSWLGRLGCPGIFDGRHVFELKSVAGGKRTRLVHREEFSGVLVPPLWGSMLNVKTRAGFEAMNKALKKQVESSGTGNSDVDDGSTHL